MTARSKYPPCDHLKRIKPDDTVTDEIASAIGSNYRTIPTFEAGLFEHVYRKHYSLENNEFLKCRWAEYKKHCEDRVIAPFQLVDIRDDHFHKCCVKIIPPETVHKRAEFRMKLKQGPGVDFRGQIPIPQELLMKRGVPLAAKRHRDQKRTDIPSKI